jgi:3-methyl-2-oxobutanoate hydroxymethyltransferase
MENSKVTIPGILACKSQKKLVMVTAYDYPSALLADGAGLDLVLVGDSLGNVVLGHSSTLPVTLDDMVRHTQAVRRGVARALLVADMPYLSYHFTPVEAARNAGRLVDGLWSEQRKPHSGRNGNSAEGRLDYQEPWRSGSPMR